MPKSTQIQLLDRLSNSIDIDDVKNVWELNARHNQYLPEGDWRTWLALAGRGFGKTRTGAETVRMWAKNFNYVNLIGATSSDARDIMVEGESGILAVCNKWDRPQYIANKNLLRWPNGGRSLIMTADQPDRMRGKQSSKLWMDELASWRYVQEAYDMAMFGLRLGKKPQTFISTTPRPIKIIKNLISASTTFTTRGSTYDNSANLAAAFLDEIIAQYTGTRLGRQELFAEILDDNPNSLWKLSLIEELRVRRVPEDIIRIVVGVDPATTSNENSCETGIVVVGLDKNRHGYVLEDCSMFGTPDQWAARAIKAYHDWNADRVVAEVNNGGDMVEAMLRSKDANVAYTKVHASRGKTKRAEPISGLYEQHRIHHVGQFAKLEDQMTAWNPQLNDSEQDSPDRMDALVWGFTDLMLKKPKEIRVT